MYAAVSAEECNADIACISTASRASFIDTRIILIDGERLVRLMVDHGVGVSTVGVYEVKKIDSDYFIEE